MASKRNRADNSIDAVLGIVQIVDIDPRLYRIDPQTLPTRKRSVIPGS